MFLDAKSSDRGSFVLEMDEWHARYRLNPVTWPSLSHLSIFHPCALTILVTYEKTVVVWTAQSKDEVEHCRNGSLP